MKLTSFTSMKRSRLLFLPIEITSREYCSKVYLASLCIQNGLDVLIGLEDLVDSYASYGDNGIFLLKIAKPQLVKMLSNNKNTIIWQDEEAGLLMVDQNLFSKSACPLKRFHIYLLFLSLDIRTA